MLLNVKKESCVIIVGLENAAELESHLRKIVNYTKVVHHTLGTIANAL